MVLRIIDIETTGTDPEKDKIIEIASVDLIRAGGSFNIANDQSHYAFPTGREIPPESSAVHHIILQDVAQAPPFEQVLPYYLKADVYVAHNASFEQGFLNAHLGNPHWLCTYRCALRVWPDAPGHSNQVLRYWRGHVEPFGRPRMSIAPHRALSDCIVTAAVLGDLIKLASWSDLLQWSKEPPLKTFCTFGTKHKGKRYDQIAVEDPSYLTWIIEKSDLDADTKWNAKHWLDARRKAA